MMTEQEWNEVYRLWNSGRRSNTPAPHNKDGVTLFEWKNDRNLGKLSPPATEKNVTSNGTKYNQIHNYKPYDENITSKQYNKLSQEQAIEIYKAILPTLIEKYDKEDFISISEYIIRNIKI